MDTDDLLETAARHEAGHAVARWLCGWPAGRLTVAADGAGYTAGTGRRVPPGEALLVILAGPAAEAVFGLFDIDWQRSQFKDFDDAREILARYWLLANGPEAALRHHFDIVCCVLLPHAELIEELAFRLMRARAISARSAAAICREYSRRKA